MSFAQEGEDLILSRLFDGQSNGVYVDIGAHHPFRFSNTYLFYRQGWRGLNVDAMPGSMAAFQRYRPRDINVEVGISRLPGKEEFFVFDEPALNTFDPALAHEYESTGQYRVLHRLPVTCLPLRDVLNLHLPDQIKEIDFMSIDAEGRDLDVLESNDWKKYRPRIVLIEKLGSRLDELVSSPEVCLLSSVGYALLGKAVHTVFFARREQLLGEPHTEEGRA